MRSPDPSPLAIACSLSADEMPARLREIAAIGQAGLLEGQVRGTRAVLRFTASEGIRRRLEAIVAAESRCCGFLDFNLRSVDEQFVLRIDAPEDAQLVLEQFVASFVAGDAA